MARSSARATASIWIPSAAAPTSSTTVQFRARPVARRSYAAVGQRGPANDCRCGDLS
jgi:hypothetical protein